MDWKRFYGPDIFSNGFAFKQLSGRQFLSLFFFLQSLCPFPAMEIKKELDKYSEATGGRNVSSAWVFLIKRH